MPETNFDFSVLETIPDTDAEIEVPEEVLEGPQTEEEQGVASLILDAISNSANTIQMYNAIIANCTDEEIIDSLNEILVDENRIMGKLQSILQKVSPNAEEIMNGAIEDSGIEESLNEGCNNQELINAVQSAYGYNKKEAKDYIKTIDDKSKEELLKGFKRNAKKSFLTDSLKESSDSRWDNIDIEDWSSEMNSKTYQIERSIKTVLKKYPESKTKIISTAKSCRNILSNLCSNLHLLYNESLNDLNEETTNPYGKAIPYQVSDELWRVRLSNRYKDLTEYDVWGYGSTTKPKDFYSEIAAEDAAAEYNQRYEDIEDELDESLSDREDIQNEIHRYNLLAPRYDKQSIIDELINDGYSYEEAEYIANHTTNLDESLKKRNIRKSLNELLSDSSFAEPSRIVIRAGGPQNYSKQRLNSYITNIVNNCTFKPEILYDAEDTVTVAIPGRQDWVNKLSDMYEESAESNIIIDLGESLRKDKNMKRYSDVLSQNKLESELGGKSVNESLLESYRENIDQFIRNYLEHHPFDSAEEMIDYLEEYGEIEELEDRFHTDVEAAIEDYFEYLDESFILDESKISSDDDIWDLIQSGFVDEEMIIDFLSDNDTVFADICKHFNITEDNFDAQCDALYDQGVDNLIDWITDHRQLWYDFCNEVYLIRDELLNESLILDESNNLDTVLDDVTPVRDVHNERAIRDHKKAKENRKKAMKEISKNVKDAFELDESLFESFYLNYEDSDLLQDWDQGGLDFSVDIHPYKYEFYTSRDANKALKIAISHGYKDSWREGRYVYLTAH